jgi:membrane-bound lytic murein transglycosylase D
LANRRAKMRMTLLFLTTLLFSACASMKSKTGADQATAASTSIFGEDVHPETLSSLRNTDPEPPEIKVPEFDNVPEQLNPYVDRWLQYFQGKGREHMERYLSRSTRYEKLMKKILRQNGLPEDIIYIALIESGFSPRAISRAAAVGYWQFIRGTGKRYGLQINSFVDERRDPEIATQAAADYFKELYGEFNSWFLSMASYNVGEGRVRREIKRNKTNDFWVLAKKRRLPKETVNYIPKFLAARLIAKDPEKYGFKEIPYETPIEFEAVNLENPVNIRKMADKMNIDYPELKRLNPKYRGEVAPLEDGKIVMRVPLTMTELAKNASKEASINDVVFVADRGETDIYKVRPGDTLNRIARRFKTNVGMIKDLNELKRGARLQPGRTIFVPLRVTESAQWEIAQRKSKRDTGVIATNTSIEKNDSESKEPSAKSDFATLTNPALVDIRNEEVEKAPIKMDSTTNINNVEEAIYIVQEGESLAEIALKNNMTMAELMELNNFTDGDALKIGTQLRVKKLQPEQGEPLIDVAMVQSVNIAPLSDSESDLTADTISSIKKHLVKSGETLYRIAKRYGTTVGALKKANNLKRKRSTIKAGTLLIIPESEIESSDTDKHNQG